MSETVVVIGDAGGAAQFVRALTQVCGTVPAGVVVVGVAARFPHLPPHLAERVEQVHLHHEDDAALAVDDLVAGEPAGSRVVAVAARAVLRSGWFASALEHAEHVPHQIGVLGVAAPGAPRLLRVLPGGLAPSRLTSYPLPPVVGVGEDPASVPAPRHAPVAPAAVPAGVTAP